VETCLAAHDARMKELNRALRAKSASSRRAADSARRMGQDPSGVGNRWDEELEVGSGPDASAPAPPAKGRLRLSTTRIVSGRSLTPEVLQVAMRQGLHHVARCRRDLPQEGGTVRDLKLEFPVAEDGTTRSLVDRGSTSTPELVRCAIAALRDRPLPTAGCDEVVFVQHFEIE
jgi:hypothetical protein